MNVTGKSDVGELVGRSQEFERLLALLEEARSGRGRTALVLGEAGIGKTRLTEVFAAAAAHVLTGRDDPLELSPAAADLLRDLPPAVQRIPLGGLDSDSTNALVKGMWGVAPAAFVSEVHHRTNGNPFFVQEVTNLRLLQG